MNLALIYLVELDIFWKLLHVFHSKYPPECLLDVKKNENLDFHGIFLKQKRMGATKNIEVSPKNLE